MRKWIEKTYRPAGFILLGTLFGSGLTLAVLGKLSTPDIVRWVACLLALGIIVVNGWRNKALFFLAICVLFAGSAAGFWMRAGKLPDAIFFSALTLIYASSAWVERGEQRTKRSEDIPIRA